MKDPVMGVAISFGLSGTISAELIGPLMVLFSDPIRSVFGIKEKYSLPEEDNYPRKFHSYLCHC